MQNNKKKQDRKSSAPPNRHRHQDVTWSIGQASPPEGNRGRRLEDLLATSTSLNSVDWPVASPPKCNSEREREEGTSCLRRPEMATAVLLLLLWGPTEKGPLADEQNQFRNQPRNGHLLIHSYKVINTKCDEGRERERERVYIIGQVKTRGRGRNPFVPHSDSGGVASGWLYEQEGAVSVCWQGGYNVRVLSEEVRRTAIYQKWHLSNWKWNILIFNEGI